MSGYEREGRAGEEPMRLPEREEPWIETRAGGWFFVNCILVMPALVALYPVVLGWMLRGLGFLEGPSRFVDTIPQVAEYMLPRLGWLAAGPLWTVWKNLRMDGVRPWTRWALYGMALLHVAVLALTVERWLGT